MISAFIFIVTGSLLILLPHFFLPLDFLEGREGALIILGCSFWYHPEIYLGTIAVTAGTLSVRYRKALYITGVTGIAGIIQGFFLKPVSFYLLKTPIIALSNTIAIRAHQYISAVIFGLSLVILLLSLYRLLVKEKAGIPNLNTYYLSSAAIKRYRFRSTVIIVAITIVSGAFFSNLLLSRSIEKTLEAGAGRLGADIIIVPEGEEETAEGVLHRGRKAIFYMDKSVLDKLRGFPGVEKVSPHLYIKPATYRIAGTHVEESLMIVAYDPDIDFTVAPWIMYSIGERQKPDDLAVGWSVKYYPGQEISLLGRSLKVLKTLEPTGLAYYDTSAFIPLEPARELLRGLKEQLATHEPPQSQQVQEMALKPFLEEQEEYMSSFRNIDPESVSILFIKAKKNAAIKELSDRIEESIKGISVVNVKSATVSVKKRLSKIIEFFFLPIIIFLLMGTLILGIVFSMSVKERQREIGLLRAIGARKSSIFRLVLTESLLLSGIGVVSGLLFGSTLLMLFKNKIMASLELLYIWPSTAVITTAMSITVIVSLAAGLIAAVYPALKASRMEPYYAIMSGGK